MIRAALFDLDGTLLPMDQDVFTKAYFSRLAGKLAPHGYEPKSLIDGVWRGVAAMVKNDGSRTNEEAFWECVTGILGEKMREDKPIFEEFYRVEFNGAKSSCGFHPKAKKIVDGLKRAGVRVVLATNPVFPAIATENRIRWAGLVPEDFEWYTTYENSRYCKPDPAYYGEIATRLSLSPADCLMVGNDADEDMAAGKLGMQTFLLTDCLINRNDADISAYPHGGFDDLEKYLSERIEGFSCE